MVGIHHQQQKNNQNPKATTKYSLCVKLPTSDLAGKTEKKKFGK